MKYRCSYTVIGELRVIRTNSVVVQVSGLWAPGQTPWFVFTVGLYSGPVGFQGRYDIVCLWKELRWFAKALLVVVCVSVGINSAALLIVDMGILVRNLA